MKKGKGGRRAGAGRPRQRLALDLPTAHDLARLTRHQRFLLDQPELTEEQVVTRLITDACVQLDAAYAKATSQAEADLRRLWQEERQSGPQKPES